MGKENLVGKHSSEICRQVYSACEEILNYDFYCTITVLYDSIADEVFISVPHIRGYFPDYLISLVNVESTEYISEIKDSLVNEAKLSLLEYEEKLN